MRTARGGFTTRSSATGASSSSAAAATVALSAAPSSTTRPAGASSRPARCGSHARRTRRRSCPTGACSSRVAGSRVRACSRRSRSGARAPVASPRLRRCSSDGTSTQRSPFAAACSSSAAPTSATSRDAAPPPSSISRRHGAGCVSARCQGRASSSETRWWRFRTVARSSPAAAAARIATTRSHGDSVAQPGQVRLLSFATATRLPDGAVLVVGGYDDRIALARGAWLLRPG